ncbi:hypothetical protein JCM15519_13980 [Fundidesulfovibrio butyratiphilus]
MKRLALVLFCLLSLSPRVLAAATTTRQPQAVNVSGQPTAPTADALADQAVLDLLFTAQEFQARGALDAARQTVVQALEKSPGDTFAAIRLAQLDALAGKPDSALARLDTVLATDPGNLLAALWQGHILYGRGRIDQARQAYAKALSLSPTNGYAHLGLACCLLAENRDKAAVEELAKAQAHAGDDHILHALLGKVFSGLGLWVNARMEFELALETNPRHVDTLVRVGEVYQRLNLPSLAQNAWRQALALEPKNPMALHHLLAVLGDQALVLLQQGHTREAVVTWRLMLTYDPINPRALHHLRALRGK